MDAAQQGVAARIFANAKFQSQNSKRVASGSKIRCQKARITEGLR
jgi:hypothetical protein